MQVDCPRCGHLLEFSRQPPRFCSACGQPLPPSEPGATRALDPGATLPALSSQGPRAPEHPDAVGGYRLLRPLGGGGMGTVYEAEEGGTGRRVALKLIRPEFADSPEAVERFRREGRLAGAVSHPRCVFVLAADEEAGQPYIVMELMPGSTLLDLVERRGRLPVPEAVALILDVLDGLEEAHRCGVVHRDVKPSNCFLDPQGRVKVGDFGLSKSLLQPQQLTQSGAFLGTVLYAAPEQIRNDSVDHLADVYSACATLYFLLTGRAPFEGGDPAETLARTLTDPLTPVRAFRPDVPRTLDAVVLRGLARNRSRRWQGLEELRLALLPFVTAPHSLAELGWRCVAYVCDALFLTLILVLLGLALRLVLRPLLLDRLAAGRAAPAGLWGAVEEYLTAGGSGLEGPVPVPLMLASMGWSLLCGLAYFALPEALWGCSAGKYLCRLRVRTVPANDRPTLWRSCLRTVVFYLLKDSGWLAANLLGTVGLVRRVPPGEGPTWALVSEALLGLLALLVLPLGFAVLASTMRRRSGYRGVHEWLSGTMVIRLPSVRPPLAVPAGAPGPGRVERPAGLPERLGPFAVRGELCRHGGEAVLVGADPVLGREVWLWVRPGGRPLSPARRAVARGTRPRWLASGVHEGQEWGAFVASPGCLLADLVSGGRPLLWADALRLLEALTEELVQAQADGTLPDCLGVDQVWVQPSGRVQLLDVPLGAGPAGAGPDPAGGERRALALLRQTAVLALEGRRPVPGESPRPIRAPVPGHGADLLARLAGASGSFATLGEVRAALNAAGELPAGVSPPRRALHLAGLGGLLAVGLLWTFGCWPLATGFTSLLLAWARGIPAGMDRCVREDGVTLVAAPGPLTRLAAAARLDSDVRLRDRLADRVQGAPDPDVLLRSSSWFVREALARVRDQAHRRAFEGRDVREVAQEFAEALDPPGGYPRDMLGDWWGWAMVVLLWPAVWVVWAFLTRGGLSLRLAGIRLLQADGRPAARWRCAWRALLVWAPVALLVLASVYLDLWRIGGALASGDPGARAWSAWVAWLSWWLALALLPAYALLALRDPARGPHDRLAGTYLVPR